MTDSEKIDIIFSKVAKIETHVAVQYDRVKTIRENHQRLEAEHREHKKDLKALQKFNNRMIGAGILAGSVSGGLAALALMIIKLFLK